VTGASRRWTIAIGFAAATAGLFAVSRGKWCDAVVDVGREWILADRLARGELLYRDIVYWFGPFTPYFESLLFRLFGSSFTTLVWAGIAGSVGVLAALFTALCRVTDRRSAALWTGLAVPALVFMPYSGGAILAMGHRMWHAAGFSLLAIALAARRDYTRRSGLAFLAGALAGAAGLCRTEWGLVALAAVGLASVTRRDSVGSAFQRLGMACGGAALAWAGVMAIFVWRAGSAAVFEDGRLLLVGLPGETRRFLWEFSGLARWRTGTATLFYSACVWFAVLAAAPLLAAGGVAKRGRGRLFLLGIPAAALLLAWWAGASVSGALFSAAPLVGLAAFAAGLAGLAGGRSGALRAFGLAALALSVRRPFDIRDAGYVAPPLLFAIVCAAALLHLAGPRLRDAATRRKFCTNVRFALVGVVAFFFLQRAVHYRGDPRVPIPGTGGALSARPAFVAEIEGLVRVIRARTQESDGLVVAPEGAVLNYLAGRQNRSRFELLIPGYLTEHNEDAVIAELERDPPAAIVVWHGATSEYGLRFFGEDYGRKVGKWIEARYDFVDFPNAERKVEGSPTRLALRRRGRAAGVRFANGGQTFLSEPRH
jgi:hypothetical protein